MLLGEVASGEVPSPPIFTSTSTMGDFGSAINKVTVSLNMPGIYIQIIYYPFLLYWFYLFKFILGMPPNLAKMSEKQLVIEIPFYVLISILILR